LLDLIIIVLIMLRREKTYTTLSHDRKDSDVHVLQIHTSVALRIKHLIIREDVVLNSILL
jgi:hypothetical protein